MPPKLWPHEISFDHDPSLGDYEIDDDGHQNWYIIGICGKSMRDDQEYYNVRYAGNHRGRTFDHLATDLEVSHPEHVEMWEEKWGEKYHEGKLQDERAFYGSQATNLGADTRSVVAKRTLDMTPRRPRQAREKRVRKSHTEVEETDDDAVGQNRAHPKRGRRRGLPDEGIEQDEEVERIENVKAGNPLKKVARAKTSAPRQRDQTDDESAPDDNVSPPNQRQTMQRGPVTRSNRIEPGNTEHEESPTRQSASFKKPKRPFENTPQKPRQAKGKRSRSTIYNVSDGNSEESDSSPNSGRHVLPARGSQSQHIGETTSGLQPERTPIRVHGFNLSEDKAASPQILESPMGSQLERQTSRRRGRGGMGMEVPGVSDRNRNVFVAGQRRDRRSRTRSLSKDSAARTTANPSREDHPNDVEDLNRGSASSHHTTPIYSLDARESPSQSTQGGNPDLPLPSVEKDNDEDSDSDSSSNLQDTLGRGIREATEAFFSQRPEIQEEATVPENPNKSAEIEARLMKAREDGLWDLIVEALKIEDLPCSNWVKKGLSDHMRGEMVQLFMLELIASMHEDILDNLLKGDLARAKNADSDLCNKLKELMPQGDTNLTPSIYINYLVNKNGLSPDPEALDKIIQKVLLYLDGRTQESHDYAFQVDNAMNQKQKWTKMNASRGERRYCEHNTAKRNCLNWIEALRARLETEPGGIPLSRALCEVGYATYPVKRLRQHRQHSDSNYIMNLVDAICRLEFPEFHIDQYVIFRLFDPMQGRLAEILFTRLCQGYTTHGGGFSHYQAGASFAHANDMPMGTYKKLKNKVMKDPAYISRLEKELDKVTAFSDLLKQAQKRLGEIAASLKEGRQESKTLSRSQIAEDAALKTSEENSDRVHLTLLNRTIELIKSVSLS